MKYGLQDATRHNSLYNRTCWDRIISYISLQDSRGINKHISNYFTSWAIYYVCKVKQLHTQMQFVPTTLTVTLKDLNTKRIDCNMVDADVILDSVMWYGWDMANDLPLQIGHTKHFRAINRHLMPIVHASDRQRFSHRHIVIIAIIFLRLPWCG